MKVPSVAPLEDDFCIVHIPKAWYSVFWNSLSAIIEIDFWDGTEAEKQQGVEWGNDLLAMVVECNDD
jgi:hypothetical protein